MALNVQVAELSQELMRQQGRIKRRGDLQRQLDEVVRQQVGAVWVVDSGCWVAVWVGLLGVRCVANRSRSTAACKKWHHQTNQHNPTQPNPTQQADVAAAIEAAQREVPPLTGARDAAVEQRAAARAAAAQREAVVDTQIRWGWGVGCYDWALDVIMIDGLPR